MIRNGFVIEPYYELKPDYKICPFTTNDIAINQSLPLDNSIDKYLQDFFGNRNYIYTASGRQAINMALSYYNLQPSDCVTIFTTSGNFYISSCVTKEIEKFCTWSRKIEDNSKVILVNHEFGFPYKELAGLKQYNLPIIEDCAHSLLSTDENNNITTIGDFVIYSFPKIFPIQFGGLLLCNVNYFNEFKLDSNSLIYLQNVLSFYFPKIEEIKRKRTENFIYLSDSFHEFNFSNRFELTDSIIPGVFMFKTNKENVDLPKLKEFLYNQGIQCSVFYGENAFYLPVHQNLKMHDLLYFKETVKYFLNTF